MRHGSLFSGIGGFDLAAQWMGWTNVFHCEFAEFPRKILEHYWPEAISYHDIKTTDFTRHLGSVDIITGGFPCQPYSAAGRRKGKDDDRHLWPEMLRVIREVRPRWVVGENVFGLTTWDGGVVLEEVCADLEAEGYAVQPFIIPAAAVGAPHRRDRVWIVANAVCSRAGGKCESISYQGRQPSRDWEESIRQTHGQIGTSRSHATGADVRFAANADSIERCEGRLHAAQWEAPERHASPCDARPNGSPAWDNFPTVAPVCGGDDGLPTELDGITFSKWRNESIKAYGNAIVPQVALQIFQAIKAMDNKS